MCFCKGWRGTARSALIDYIVGNVYMTIGASRGTRDPSHSCRLMQAISPRSILLSTCVFRRCFMSDAALECKIS